jgi:hypothetical protein
MGPTQRRPRPSAGPVSVFEGSAGHHGSVRKFSCRGMPSGGSSTDVYTIRGVLLLLLIVWNFPELNLNAAGAAQHDSVVPQRHWAGRACLRSPTTANSIAVAWNCSLHDGQNGLRYSQPSNTMRDGPDSLLQRWLQKGAPASQEKEVVGTSTTHTISTPASIVTSAAPAALLAQATVTQSGCIVGACLSCGFEIE